MVLTTADGLQPLLTRDDSFTLRNESLDVFYHSVHGAIQESTHVFIKAGLEQVQKLEVDVLEVGLGTGLNLLLTWIRCWEGKCRVRYTALEPNPLSKDLLEQLDHCNELAWPGLHAPFLERMTASNSEWAAEHGGLRFRMLPTPLLQFNEEAAYDLIYFDAFAPRTQPELWTTDAFARMHAALRPGGMLVTYCAKGVVRRAMMEAGLSVERLPGPVGKREMFRATKPS
ncbi:MAG: tRNA (5-methylaminomethyl-2-thiouridine)(34)-methyltransferase MnmD [Flavobacteriales bacterium]